MKHPFWKDSVQRHLQPKQEIVDQQVGLESPKHRFAMILLKEPIEVRGLNIIDRRLEKATTHPNLPCKNQFSASPYRQCRNNHNHPPPSISTR
jgi:hypothetical protein